MPRSCKQGALQSFEAIYLNRYKAVPERKKDASIK
jgi:hypothetical protein